MTTLWPATLTETSSALEASLMDLVLTRPLSSNARVPMFLEPWSAKVATSLLVLDTQPFLMALTSTLSEDRMMIITNSMMSGCLILTLTPGLVSPTLKEISDPLLDADTLP